jgi:hypothetical protein
MSQSDNEPGYVHPVTGAVAYADGHGRIFWVMQPDAHERHVKRLESVQAATERLIGLGQKARRDADLGENTRSRFLGKAEAYKDAAFIMSEALK